MARGGRRPGAGRKPGGRNPKGRVIDKRAQEFAAKISKLPHEVLYQAGIDGELDGETLTLPQRLDCLKSVASYFAPKLTDSRVLAAEVSQHKPFDEQSQLERIDTARRIAFTLQQAAPERPLQPAQIEHKPSQPVVVPVASPMVVESVKPEPLTDEQVSKIVQEHKLEAEELEYQLSRTEQKPTEWFDSDRGRPNVIRVNPGGRWRR